MVLGGRYGASQDPDSWEVAVSVQRPWMQIGGECGDCVTALPRTGMRSPGTYEHVHQVSKIPRRRIANRQWVRCPGWVVRAPQVPFWVFFAEIEAAVAFARAGMQSADYTAAEIRHAYTESVLSTDLLARRRRFLGVADPANRCLFNTKLLQSWVDHVVEQEGNPRLAEAS